MSYDFTFDLSRLSQALFQEIAAFSEHGKINEKIGTIAKNLVKKFHVDKMTGLPVGDSITIVEDLIEIHLKNSVAHKKFIQTQKQALFLPHCCRKYMDSRCKATFDTEFSCYRCAHCSSDCNAHLATRIAEEEQYDVYILPGGSGVRKILQKARYDGIVGVACTDELQLGMKILEQYNTPYQAIPLTKNGCSQTQFNIETLQWYLKQKIQEA